MRHCDLIVYGNNDEIRRRGRKHTRTNVCHVWYTLGNPYSTTTTRSVNVVCQSWVAPEGATRESGGWKVLP